MHTYRDALATHSALAMNPEPSGIRNGFWMPTVVFSEASGITREQIQTAFSAENIDARVFFWPLSGLPMFEPAGTTANAWSIPTRAINLPSYHDMSAEDLLRTCAVIHRLLIEAGVTS
jgi:perosamine synthetase